MDKRYQVFVSSTFADLKDERSKVIQTVMELDCFPAGMEAFPAIDEEQFEFIKKIIDDCDYYLLVIGGRYGSISDDGLSYTEKEYNYAVEKGIKIVAFIHGSPDSIPLGKSEKDNGLREKLDLFKTKVSTNRLIKYWNHIDELPGLVALSLSKTIKMFPAVGWVRANQVINPEIIQEMNHLRSENQRLKDLLEYNAKLESEEDENLASFDDVHEFFGTNSRYGKYGTITDTWKINISWKELFSTIAPFLLSYPNDEAIKSTIATELFKLCHNYTKSGTPRIDEQVFQTIKIHLASLKLISVKYTKTTNGGMALFWNLTDLGNKLMLHLRSVKK